MMKSDMRLQKLNLNSNEPYKHSMPSKSRQSDNSLATGYKSSQSGRLPLLTKERNPKKLPSNLMDNY